MREALKALGEIRGVFERLDAALRVRTSRKSIQKQAE
jgi:hypothetical protein